MQKKKTRFSFAFSPLICIFASGMLQGHGDDTYHYKDVRTNFSSNIFAHADLSGLKTFLASRLDVIARYPEPEACSLEAMIARREDIPAECVLVTNGATEAIYLIAQMLSADGVRHCHIPQPTFSEYRDACRMFGLTESPDGVLWLCNPNNPTGRVYPRTSYLAPRTSPIILDQSYEHFTLCPVMTAAEAVSRGDVIQIHSLTKTYAVPGLRLGYIVASAEWIGKLRRLMRPWSVGALAVEAGKWLMAHGREAVADVPSYLAETRRLRDALNAVPGIHVLPTDTCFMLATIGVRTAAELKDYLAWKHGMLIRDASNFEGLTPHHFRVSTQLPAENDQLVAAVQDFCENSGSGEIDGL